MRHTPPFEPRAAFKIASTESQSDEGRSRNRCAMLGRIIHDVADVKNVHLPAQTFVGRVHGYNSSIPTEPWVQVDPV